MLSFLSFYCGTRPSSPLLFFACFGQQLTLCGKLEGSSGLGTCANNKSELFVNGERMLLARFPNIDPNTRLWNFNLATGGTDIEVGFATDITAHVQKWVEQMHDTAAGKEEVWLHGYWKLDWADNYVKLASADLQKHILVRDNATAFSYGQHPLPFTENFALHTVPVATTWYSTDAITLVLFPHNGYSAISVLQYCTGIN